MAHRNAPTRRMLLVVLATLLVLVLSPRRALAREYRIDQVDIEATVGSDGSLSVREVREFDFDGSFHGVYWRIPTAPTLALDDNPSE